MGWMVLYIAFGIVALWLLGEVLLQYKARLRWRALAFCGFLGVVLGVLIPSIVVIALGAIAFAVGQTYVTLSFRRGFSTGWAIGGRPGGSKRRRTGSRGRQEPTLEVSDLEPADGYYAPGEQHADGTHADDGAYARDTTAYPGDTAYADDDVFRNDRDPSYAAEAATHAGAAAYGYDQFGAGPASTVYEPEPLPDDTGQYGVYSDTAYAAAAAQGQGGTPDPTQNQGTPDYGYDSYAGYDQQQGYDQDAHQYAAYSDPYIGTQGYDGQAYDPYAQQAYPQDAYAPGGYGETPPGGVWVPQQRGVEGQSDPYGGELPPEQPYPYQNDGYPAADPGAGYDGQQQYRY
ncbi:hypothetical protein ACFVT5_24490 [Streptomyces sp. NPDC058001]|uniref:SCO2102 family sporulation regulator n=1 Tax=Streptomyces sp. NPDC058001 TaxID=3346300 RepID=UPI0036E5415D